MTNPLCGPTGAARVYGPQKGVEADADMVEALDFGRHIEGAALVITGEGRTDAQSVMGKVASGVGRRAAAAGVPAVVLSGALEEGCETLHADGVTALFACCSRVQWQMEHARENLSFAAEQLFRLLAAVGMG